MDLRIMHIGQKIKKLRELKNLTQTHVAEKLGLSQSAYSKMELGETEVTYNRLEKISEILVIKPEEVILFNESMVFKAMNSPNGSNVLSHIDQNAISDSERQLYQDQINLLKEEVSYLKKLIEKVLK